jgi:subtilisin
MHRLIRQSELSFREEIVVMRRLRVVPLAVVWALMVVVGVFCTADEALGQGDALVRRIVVFQDSFVNEPAQAGLLRAFGGEPLRPLPLVNGMVVLLPPPAESMLVAHGDVAQVYVDARVRALGKPASPPGLDKKKPDEQPPQELPWGVDRIDAEWAWAVSRGAGVSAAVIDTGIDKDHPDLVANIAGGVNFVSKPPWKPADPNKWDDDSGHGTHVAGIIAAEDNDIGVIGVASQASLYAVKVLDRSGSGYVSDVISGIEWCIANGMHIANMSLGTDADIGALEAACEAAADAGVLLVAAAGNDGGDVDYPGAYPTVIAVAATDAADNVPSWSSPGPEVAIAAPGVNVRSTWKGGGYETGSGTSMATPHVSGTLALVLAAAASTDLCSDADDLPPAGVDIYTGCGLVDAGESVTGIADCGDNLP